MTNFCYQISLALTNISLALNVAGYVYFGAMDLFEFKQNYYHFHPISMLLIAIFIIIERIMFWKQEIAQLKFTGAWFYFYLAWRILLFVISLIWTSLIFFIILSSIGGGPVGHFFAAAFNLGLLTFLVYFCVFLKAMAVYCIGNSSELEEINQELII